MYQAIRRSCLMRDPRIRTQRLHTCFHAACASGALLLLSGCERAPAYSILGSFFPVWIFCGIAGIVFAFAVHLVLVRYQQEHQFAPPLLVYPALALVATFTLWLAFFS